MQDDSRRPRSGQIPRIKAHALVPARIAVYGNIYDVRTGRLIEVPSATEADRATA
jgi:carbonic anhydrase